jgi:murein L,D-transpeptidase YcbB/YkuD
MWRAGKYFEELAKSYKDAYERALQREDELHARLKKSEARGKRWDEDCSAISNAFASYANAATGVGPEADRAKEIAAVAAKENPDAWRTVVIDEDLAKYYSPGKPGDSGKYAIYGSLEEHVRHILTRERFLTEERKFDAKVAASIERLADAKVVPASYPETIYHPAPGISQASLDALRKAGKDAKAKAPRRGRK